MKSVLVTGGAGYIGSHTIIELLNDGYDVVSIDNFSNSSQSVFNQIFKLTGKKIKNYNINLCDFKKLQLFCKDKKFDAIIHFAAFKAVGESVLNPLKYYDNNIGSLLGALIIARSCKVSSFIYSSSAAIYDSKGKAPFSERSAIDPASPYGMTKKIGEEILFDYFQNSPSFKVLSLRYFNPAGAHPSIILGEKSKGVPNNLVPIITSFVKNKKIFSVFGNTYKTKDGTCIRDYIHVVDVAHAHVLSLKYLENQKSNFCDVFNIGTGKGTSVLEIIKSFEKVNGIKANFKYDKKRPGDVPVLFADIKKIQKVLNFKPKYDISDMLKTAWEWEKKN